MKAFQTIRFRTTFFLFAITSSLIHASPETTAASLINIFAILLPVVNTPLYDTTQALHTRNIHSYPLFYGQANEKQIKFDLFYNQTNKKKLNNDSTDILDYLHYINPTTISSMVGLVGAVFNNSEGESPIVEQITELSPFLFDVLESITNQPTALNDLLETIKKGHIQERRVGVMTTVELPISSTVCATAKVPFLWIEHNLNYTSTQRAALEKNPIIKTLSSQDSSFDEWEFAKKHLIYDEIGLGNLEVDVHWNVYNEEIYKKKLCSNAKIDLIAHIDFPSEITFSRGLLGNEALEAKDRKTSLNILSLIDIPEAGQFSSFTISPNGKDLILNHGMLVFDHIFSSLLQTSLGNKSHMGFGLATSGHFENIAKSNISLTTQIKVKKFISSYEARFFSIKNKEIQELSDQFAQLQSTPVEYTQAFDELIANMLFPRVLNAKVNPGLIAQSTTCLNYTFHEQNPWHISIGADNYWQNKEKISNIQADSITIDALNIQAAQRNQNCYQLKIFSKIHHVFHSKNYAWHLGAYVDGTVYDSNMGNDITVALSLDYEF